MSLRNFPSRKRLGQVFLRDPQVIAQILTHAALQAHENILEIGPGRGALTAALADASSSLFALEIDPYYVTYLQKMSLGHTTILQGDARLYDYAQLPAPLVVVSNLPYSAGMMILQRLLLFRERFSRLILMFQAEVAERLLATPGSRAYGALSVTLQYYMRVQPCFPVSRQAFSPVPAVDSAVVAFYPFALLPYPSQEETFLWQVIRCAFAHRRKVLRSNLLMLPSLNRSQIADVFATLHLQENVRAQELSVAQFVQLADALLAFRRS